MLRVVAILGIHEAAAPSARPQRGVTAQPDGSAAAVVAMLVLVSITVMVAVRLERCGHNDQAAGRHPAVWPHGQDRAGGLEVAWLPPHADCQAELAQPPAHGRDWLPGQPPLTSTIELAADRRAFAVRGAADGALAGR